MFNKIQQKSIENNIYNNYIKYVGRKSNMSINRTKTINLISSNHISNRWNFIQLYLSEFRALLVSKQITTPLHPNVENIKYIILLFFPAHFSGQSFSQYLFIYSCLPGFETPPRPWRWHFAVKLVLFVPD